MIAFVPHQFAAPAARRGRRVIGRITAAMVALFAGVALALTMSLTLVPMLGSAHTLTVLTGSMQPTIPAGSVVVVKQVEPRSIALGDVITYATTDSMTGAAELVTHRVVGIQPGPVFVTKGDANQVVDERPVRADQVRGRVWYHLPLLGSLRGWLFTRATAGYLGALALFLLGLYLLRDKTKKVAGDARH